MPKSSDHGGTRSNAGRPRGSKNKVTAKREAEVAAAGLTPLDYMLGLLRSDESSADDRKWAAQAAAPYCHHRLSAIEHSGTIEDKAAEQPEDLSPMERRIKEFAAERAGKAKSNGSGTVH